MSSSPPRPSPSGGRPVVLLHGFLGSPQSWDPVISHRMSQSRVMAVALPGHRGGAPVASDFRGVVRQVAAGLEAAGLPPAHIVGYSLGARLGLGLAVEAPERVAALTLVGLNPGLDAEAARARRVEDEGWASMLETGSLEAFVAAWERLPLWASQARLGPELRAARRAARCSHEPRELARCLRAAGLGAMPDHRGDFAGLQVPVTLVAGGLDDKFVAIARALVRRRPSTRLVVVEGVGHDVGLEAPAALEQIIMEESR